MKKIKQIFLAGVVLLASGVGARVVAETNTVASGSCGTNLSWSLDSDSVLTIIGTGSMKNYDWTYATDSVNTPWYIYRTAIKKVVFPSGIEYIGENAFRNCSNLRSVDFPATTQLSTIGKNAFEDCKALTSISLPSTVTSIKMSAFYGCSSLTSIVIPDRVTSIENSTFVSCTALSSITLHEGITSIGAFAFNACKALSSISLPSTVTSIGDRAFFGCGLTSINLPDNITSIGAEAFSSCTALTSVKLPSSLTSIKHETFQSCSQLATVDFPSGLTTIEWSAFWLCSSLKRINLPGAITTIGNYAFYACTQLCSVDFSAATSLTTIGNSVFYDCSQLDSVNIPDNVTSIGSSAFSGCSKLSRITLPAGLTVIESSTFNGCKALDTITLPAGLTSIGNSAFQGCKIKSLNIPEGVSIIENYTFYNCTALDTITLPAGLTSIGTEAFRNCSALTAINLPQGLKTIGGSAFYDCSKLTAINLPQGLETIGISAFQSCSKLTEIDIPQGVDTIGSSAFSGCTKLKKVTNRRLVPQTIEASVFTDVSVGSITLVVPGASVSAYEAAEVWKDFKKPFIEGYTVKVLAEESVFGTVSGEGFYEKDSSATLAATAQTGYSFTKWNDEVTTNPRTITVLKDTTFTAIFTAGANTVALPAFEGWHEEVYIDSAKVELTCATEGATIYYRKGESGEFVAYTEAFKIDTTTIVYAYGDKDGMTNSATASRLYNVKRMVPIDTGSCGTHLKWILSHDSILTISGSGAMTDYVYRNDPESDNSPWYAHKTKIKRVVLPAEITSIGDHAFMACTLLDSVDFTAVAHLTTIGNNAFNGCSALSFLSLPAEVTKIGNGAFANCSALRSLNIPTGVTEIKYSTFSKCSNLSSVTLPDGITTIGSSAFAYCEKLSSLHLPNALTFLGESAFEGCAQLAVINLPTGLKSIENRTFYECKALSSLNIPEEVTSIGMNAFYNCSELSTVNLPAGLETLSFAAFSGCKKLRRANIPEKITAISGFTFNGCSQLDTLTLPENLVSIENSAFNGCSQLDSIYLPAKITTMGSYVFSGCSKLRRVNLPAGLSVIESSTFKNCSLLDSITLPAGLTSIGESAFSGCSKLTEIDIPQGVATIGGSAFVDCSGLKKVVNRRSVPQSIEESVFSRLSLGSINLVVPGASIAAYKDSAVWKSFSIKGIFTVTAAANNASFGTVSGGGLYEQDSSATLTANHAAYYHFVKWNDDSTANPRKITVVKDTTLTAIFAIDTFTITVLSSNASFGTVSGGGKYPYKGTATLKAEAKAGYKFTKWDDGSAKNPRTVTVTENKTYTASFAEAAEPEPTKYTVTVVASPSAGGSIEGDGEYTENATATLTAKPAEHYHFVKWSDDTLSNPRTITVVKDTTLTACFALDTFAVTAAANNGDYGEVSGGGRYAYGSEVSLNATPAEHYHFVKWSDDTLTNPRSISVLKDTTLTAIFAIDTFRLTLKINENASYGSVVGGGRYTYGKEVNFSAAPNPGYKFVRWNDGVVARERNITIISDTTFTAYFSNDTLTVSVGVNPYNSGTVSGGGRFAYGSTATLTATPKAHYHFVRWSDNNTENPRSITVTKAVSLTAYFALDTFAVAAEVNPTAGGEVSGAGRFAYGSTATLTATANEGYHFVKWSDDTLTNPRTITVVKDTSLTAYFVLDTFTVAAVANPTAGGEVSGTGRFAYGSTATLTATANEGYRFVKWNDDNTANPRTITVTKDTSLTAEFALIPDTVDAPAFVGWQETAYNDSARVELKCDTAGAKVYYRLGTNGDFAEYTAAFYVKQTTSVFAYGAKAGLVNSDTISKVYTVQKTEPTPPVQQDTTYTLTVQANNAAWGTVSGSGTYKKDTTVQIKAVANEGYKFVQWKEDNDTNAIRSIKVVENATYTAVFEAVEGPGVDNTITNPLTATRVYPNPNNGRFTIDVAEAARMEVYNAAGIRVMSAELSAGKREVSLPAAGLYFIKLTAADRSDCANCTNRTNRSERSTIKRVVVR